MYPTKIDVNESTVTLSLAYQYAAIKKAIGEARGNEILLSIENDKLNMLREIMSSLGIGEAHVEAIADGINADFEEMDRVDMSKVPAPIEGYKRQWLRCRKCGKQQYYDFIPYSTSNPFLDSVCGHNVKQDMDRIEESELNTL